MAKADLTAERLRELLHYDPETGVFTWAVKIGRLKAGAAAGCLHKASGYRVIRIGDRLYKAHRLAWLYVHGKWPEHFIDHRSGKRDDNRMGNLRDVSQNMNMQNQRLPTKNSKSGLLGASWSEERHKWVASIRKSKKTYPLGRYDTPEEAHAAYVAAKRKLHEGCTI